MLVRVAIFLNQMSNTFFTSDTHFSHANIIKYCNRPWQDPSDWEIIEGNPQWKSHAISRQRAKEMDEALIANWNNTVSYADDVWHLGDFNFGTAEDTAKLIERLKFRKLYFIWGNHDSAMEQLCTLTYSRDSKYQPFRSKVYWCGDMKEIRVNGQKIVLNHYAMKVWNRSHHGAWHLYGHSHGSLADDPHSLSFDVGVDCHNYRPISFDEVKDIMSKKFFKPIDHHTGKEVTEEIKLTKDDYEKANRKRLYEQLKKEFEGSSGSNGAR